MNAPGRVLAWVCMAVVALPLSPCAFFAKACRHHQEQAARQVAQTAARSCCAQHTKPADEPSQSSREKPCPGECCRLSPFAQTGEKLIPAAPALALGTVLPHFDLAPPGEADVLSSAAPQPLSLQILHCQWRC